MKSTKTYSCIQETTIARYLEWKRISGSGARLDKGDISSPTWLGECKTHTSPGHPIQFAPRIWTKLCKEAMASMRVPILFVDDGSQSISHTWCLIDPNICQPIVGWQCRPAPKEIVRGLITFDEFTLHEYYSAETLQRRNGWEPGSPIVYTVTDEAFGRNHPTVGFLPLQDFAPYFRGK